MKALNSLIQYRQLSEDYPSLKSDASLQLTRLYMKLAERRTDQESLQFVIKAYEASTQGTNILFSTFERSSCFFV